MGATGSSSEQAHALILSGLRHAEQYDLVKALNHWALASELDPGLRAASMLVELTELFLEARQTGVSVEPPDFRSHLIDLRYPLPGSAGSNEPSGRVPGSPSASGRVPGSPSASGRASSRPPVTTASDSQLDAIWQGPPVTAKKRRTIYGPPHRAPEDTSPSDLRLGGRPRYQASAPPPPAYRRHKSPSSRQPIPGQRTTEERPERRPGRVDSRAPTEVTRPTTGRRREARGEGFDPWADLSSELAEVSSDEWTVPGGETAVSDAEAQSARDEVEQAPRRAVSNPALRSHPPAVTGELDDDDDLPEPLRDPFAVLDEHGLRMRSLTGPGLHLSPPTDHPRESEPGRPYAPVEDASSESSGGADSGLVDLFDDENLPFGDPFEGEPLLRSDAARLELLPEPSAVVVESTGEGELFDFELLDDDAGEAATNPVYTPPWQAGDEPQQGPSSDELWERARHHHSLGDYSTSEKLLQQLLDADPGHAGAEDLLGDNRAQREKGHLVRLRSVEATPRIVLGQEQLVWQNLDAKKGFVLSRVDGLLTVEDIIDISNLPRHETIRILADLVEEGILAMT